MSESIGGFRCVCERSPKTCKVGTDVVRAYLGAHCDQRKEPFAGEGEH